MSRRRGSSTATPQFDNLLLQSLMPRLELRPRNLLPLPPLSAAAESLDDLCLSMFLNESDSDSEKETSSKTYLAKEESKLEKEIVRTILGGEIEKLKPNSGQAITIGEHHICVGFHEETGSTYRVWEWHGHIVLVDEENGYDLEYIYGNYFERIGTAKREINRVMPKKDDVREKEIEEDKVGLKELFECGGSGSGRILHRSTAPSNSGFI
ncbi:hypothetical protein ACP275_12G136600 [Erythranthe tilingii]